jgi:ABC-2 type transport system permease protein
VVAVFLVQQDRMTGEPAGNAGIRLFQLLAVVQLLLVLLVTPASAAGAISGERHGQTWDLLLVSGLSSFDIIWGKLISIVAFNLLLVVMPLPVYAAVFLFGGVSRADMLQVELVLGCAVLLLCGLSLLVSMASRRPAVSTIIGVTAGLILGIGLTLVVALLETGSHLQNIVYSGGQGPLGLGNAALSPIAQIDPLIALLSVLPNGGNSTLLGSLGRIHHAFGLHRTIPMAEAFAILSIGTMLLATALCAVLTRFNRTDSRQRSSTA